jgi:hypothetical protein
VFVIKFIFGTAQFDLLGNNEALELDERALKLRKVTFDPNSQKYLHFRTHSSQTRIDDWLLKNAAHVVDTVGSISSDLNSPIKDNTWK